MFNPQKSTVFTSPVTGQLFMLAPNQPILVNSHHTHSQHLVDQFQLQHQLHQLQNQADGRPSAQQQQFFRIGSMPSPNNQSELRQQQQQHQLSRSSNFETHLTISPQNQLSTLQQNDLTRTQQEQQEQLSMLRNRVTSAHQIKLQQEPRNEPERSQSQQISIDMTLEKKCLTHYIDGQFIYETSKIKPTKTKKSAKKKKPTKRVKLDDGQSEILLTREQMPSWSVTDVVEFIKTIPDIGSYANKFEENEIDGKALLIMIDRNLNLHVLASMFKHGPAMKIEAALSKYKLENDNSVD